MCVGGGGVVGGGGLGNDENDYGDQLKLPQYVR